MRSLLSILFCLNISFSQAASAPQQGTNNKKSAENLEVPRVGPEAEELNTAPTPVPEASESEKFPGTLSIGENYRLGPYDREGNYMHKQPPEIEEAQEALEAQEQKEEELERVHGEELLDYSTRPKQ